MRVLVSTTSGAGHWVPLLPIVGALSADGHDVLVACPESAADALRARGVPVEPFADVGAPPPEQVEMFSRASETGDPAWFREAITFGFGYVSPSAAMPGLAATWDRFGPDLVLRDPGEGASAVLAERHSTPSAIGAGGLLASLAGFLQMMGEPTDRLRAEHGLDPLGGAMPDRLALTATPSEFDRPGPGPPVHRFGLDRPLVPPPTTEPPLVYATLGTELAGQGDLGARLVAMIADAVSSLGVECTLTTGSDPAATGLVEPRLDLRAHADHREIIPACRVVLTHGGAGTVQDAVHMGRPMVVLPQFADQFDNGSRVEELGLGSCLVGEAQTSEAIADALRTALDGGHDREVAAMARAAAALPPVNTTVAALEALLA